MSKNLRQNTDKNPAYQRHCILPCVRIVALSPTPIAIATDPLPAIYPTVQSMLIHQDKRFCLGEQASLLKETKQKSVSVNNCPNLPPKEHFQKSPVHVVPVSIKQFKFWPLFVLNRVWEENLISLPLLWLRFWKLYVLASSTNQT